MMPTLVAKPPQGDDWTHEVKFVGHRSQILIDNEVTRLFFCQKVSYLRNSPQVIRNPACL
ncbi:hypothetical protein MES5069_190027 [Mesorhizobium escarrei]|uniref:ATP-dependent DNA ligase family profile domain-containing protein n=1 Tax=Mesorhizobium escarrei TaxID=666018 RepID=A0ABN8JN23_9HYPH|nr:hypothetical protein MES5069_190027 [Mesorhizobium escarrei]